MYCLTLESHDPYFNLAVEELLLKNSREEYFILGINNPSVIVGKHQTVHREINTRFVTENNIAVIRRISGGGTVYHDRGNLNFTFIRQSEEGRQVDFLKYTRPVMDFLHSEGVDVRFEGKNDLKIDGFKISGNAEHVHRNRVLHHGTLLFSSSLDVLKNSLRKEKSCYSTRAVDSNPSSVININERIRRFAGISEFRSAMMNYFLRNLPDTEAHILSAEEKENAGLISSSKYVTWEWNYAYGPEYNFNNSFNFNGVIHQCSLFVKNGLIVNCEIKGSETMDLISKKLIGCPHMVGDIKEVFLKEDITVSDDEIYKFF
jgi:lipoate---protein ligase